MEEYIRVKELITKNQGPEDVCVLNYEDEVLRKFGENIVPKVVYFSSLRKLDRESIWTETRSFSKQKRRDPDRKNRRA